MAKEMNPDKVYPLRRDTLIGILNTEFHDVVFHHDGRITVQYVQDTNLELPVSLRDRLARTILRPYKLVDNPPVQHRNGTTTHSLTFNLAYAVSLPNEPHIIVRLAPVMIDGHMRYGVAMRDNNDDVEVTDRRRHALRSAQYELWVTVHSVRWRFALQQNVMRKRRAK